MKKLILKKIERLDKNPYDGRTPEEIIYDEIYNNMELLSDNYQTFEEVYNREIEVFTGLKR